MALQSSGQITFGNISNEFGLPPGKNLGAYRVTENYGSLSSLPLDNTIPQSGEIRFSDFYGRRLNVVVDCHSGGALPAEFSVSWADIRYHSEPGANPNASHRFSAAAVYPQYYRTGAGTVSGRRIQ